MANHKRRRGVEGYLGMGPAWTAHASQHFPLALQKSQVSLAVRTLVAASIQLL
jgi:hypothetical protein